jgi:hypothetical protein
VAGQTTSLVVQNLVVADDQRSCTVREEALSRLLRRLPGRDVALAKLCLQPADGPMSTPIPSPRNFGRVPRVYIECLRDRAPARLKKRMYTAPARRQVISMDTSHLAFFSAPQALVDHLLGL